MGRAASAVSPGLGGPGLTTTAGRSGADAHRLEAGFVEDAAGSGEVADAGVVATQTLVPVPRAEEVAESAVLL